MKASEIRAKFINFFEGKGHTRVSSSSLVPSGDATLLFSNAGMVQFKDVFTGTESRSYSRATSSQKCVRAGGKHNDLDEVGRTPRHHTFFEMLGNFSFGDYFKEDAITWAWELLTEEYGIDPSTLIITYFKGDESMGIGPDTEARDIWKRVTGFGDDRIIGLGTKENFWMMGDVGPMGPCSEIHYNAQGASIPTTDSPDNEWEPWLEIWNLVFMQYQRNEKNGPLSKLPAPSIDTGAGLERLASVLQNKTNNYDTDVFTPIIAMASEISGVSVGDAQKTDTSLRVIADHARTATFLICDGVFPDKTGREYVLRRIFRRAVRHGKLLGIEEPFMHKVCATVIEHMKDAYPELVTRKAVVNEVALEEEKRFRSTLDRGLNLLDETFVEMKKKNDKTISGDRVFQLYDTYGFPQDLTEIIANENGYAIDHKGFEDALAEARARSKFSGQSGDVVDDVYKNIGSTMQATTFLRDSLTSESEILAILLQGKQVESASTGDKVAFVTDSTPFYAESGGQVGDSGIAKGAASLTVTDTKKFGTNVHFHFATIAEGTLSVGQNYSLQVDGARRNAIRANHSATHLLHLALKNVLGDHVTQKGSLVNEEKLRFDFSHFHPISSEEKEAIETWVNQQVINNAASSTEVLPIEEAQKRGAVAMFGEKYGETVRVVRVGDESLEFCGGTHVNRTGDIGLFKLVGEQGIAQGVRRIEAVTAMKAINETRKLERALAECASHLKVTPAEVPNRIAKMRTELKSLEKQVTTLGAKLAAGGQASDSIETTAGVRWVATKSNIVDSAVLRKTGDALRDKIASGVVIVIGSDDSSVRVLTMVTKDLHGKLHAGELLKAMAPHIDGRGGGKPDMAQGGGKNVSGIPQALDAARNYIATAAN